VEGPSTRQQGMWAHACALQGADTTTVILGEVARFHVHEGVASKSPSGKLVVDPVKLQPVSRLGGNTCAPVVPSRPQSNQVLSMNRVADTETIPNNASVQHLESARGELLVHW
jgi:hypothetical protein